MTSFYLIVRIGDPSHGIIHLTDDSIWTVLLNYLKAALAQFAILIWAIFDLPLLFIWIFDLPLLFICFGYLRDANIMCKFTITMYHDWISFHINTL
jgi:hypothetical protein